VRGRSPRVAVAAAVTFLSQGQRMRPPYWTSQPLKETGAARKRVSRAGQSKPSRRTGRSRPRAAATHPARDRGDIHDVGHLAQAVLCRGQQVGQVRVGHVEQPVWLTAIIRSHASTSAPTTGPRSIGLALLTRMSPGDDGDGRSVCGAGSGLLAARRPARSASHPVLSAGRASDLTRKWRVHGCGIQGVVPAGTA
jgi:hypothetical protein